jgi:signal transduction histidine kinase
MIRRVRIGFVVLAVALLAPLALLLGRTLESLNRERELRHEAVASRVFDEAERLLSQFLHREEERPADHYFLRTQSGEASPLAEAPEWQFVLGYFQLDGRGAISTPRSVGAAELATKLREILGEDVLASGQALELGRLQRDEEATAQRPGTTKTVQKMQILTGRALREDKDAAPGEVASLEKEVEKKDEYSSYSLFERLNTALAMRRKQRSAQQTQAPAPARSRVAFEGAEGVGAADLMQEPEEAMELARQFPSELPPGALQRRTGRAPMAAAVVDAKRMILHRTVAISGAGTYEQGILIDLDRLTGWLEGRVVGESGLREFVALDFSHGEGWGADASGSAPYERERFVYRHRFGEPFESLSARLSLLPLPDQGGTGYVYAIGLLLSLASTVGLWAVYRTVAAAVDFSERRSNFAAAVSHELKTPLTAIRMYGEMLRDGMVSDEAKEKEYSATITAEAERLTRLIQNVLEFSKLERGAHQLDLVRGSLGEPMREVLRILEPHARSQGFVLALDLDDPLPAVRFDPDAFQQILFNLIDNALKYAATADTKRVELSARRVEGAVEVRVRDYGPGVSREHRPHLFDAFYRGEKELTRRSRGAGIGLALVQSLAKQMDVAVSARNRPEGGFEVALGFPLSG